MKRYAFVMAILTISLISLIGCATFNDYKAKTSDEEEIKASFIKFWEQYNNKNAEGVLSFFHKDAKIMTGKERNVLSKQEYSELLPKRFKSPINFRKGSPKMMVNGDKAVVKIPYSASDINLNLLVEYELVKENGHWYIMSTKY